MSIEISPVLAEKSQMSQMQSTNEGSTLCGYKTTQNVHTTESSEHDSCSVCKMFYVMATMPQRLDDKEQYIFR